MNVQKKYYYFHELLKDTLNINDITLFYQILLTEMMRFIQPNDVGEFNEEFINVISKLIDNSKKFFNIMDDAKWEMIGVINARIYYYCKNQEFLKMMKDIDYAILMGADAIDYDYEILTFIEQIHTDIKAVLEYLPERECLYKRILLRSNKKNIMIFILITYKICVTIKKVRNDYIKLTDLESIVIQYIKTHKKSNIINLSENKDIKEMIDDVCRYGSTNKRILKYLDILTLEVNNNDQPNEKKLKRKISTSEEAQSKQSYKDLKFYKREKFLRLPMHPRDYNIDEEKPILERAEKAREEEKKKITVEANKIAEKEKKEKAIKDKKENEEKEEKMKIEKINSKKRRKNETILSKNVYNFLKSKGYEISIGCNTCFIWSKDIKYFLHKNSAHKCTENQLYLHEDNSKSLYYILIRDPPRQIKMKRKEYYVEKIHLCEDFQKGRDCFERKQCPDPHTDIEKVLWAKFFLNVSDTYNDFLSDMKSSRLLLHEIIANILKVRPGKFELICRQCFEAENIIIYKKKHNQICLNQHSWKPNAMLVFNTVTNNANKYIHGSELSKILEYAFDKDFDDVDIVHVSDSLVELENKKNILKNLNVENDDEQTVDPNLSELNICIDPEEFIDKNFDFIFEDNNSEFNEMESMSSERSNKNHASIYANMNDMDLEYNLKIDPFKFRKGIITLINPAQAVCRFIDGKHCLYENEIDENLSKLEKERILELQSLHRLQEVEIRGRSNCGQAFNGDEVIVEIKNTKEVGDDGKKVHRGTVVRVLKESFDRKSYTFLCQVDSYISHLMMPIDAIAPKIHVHHAELLDVYKDDKESRNQHVSKYILKDGEKILDKTIRLNPKLRQQLLFLVKYEHWNMNYMYPYGYVCGILRRGEGLEDSQNVLNLLYQVPTKPNLKCKEYIEKFELSNLDLSNRTDFSNKFTISIDPPNCKDVDDAISIDRIDGHNYEIMIHIADVTAFVKKDDIIDRDAFKRTTSYYPALSTVYSMLPQRLCDDICSIHEKDKKLAISVKFEVNFEGTISDEKSIYRSIIKNDIKFTYEQVQDIIETLDKNSMNKVQEAIYLLNTITQKIREKRLNKGYFYNNVADDPFNSKPCFEAHQIIEELMILTNKIIAEFIVDKFPEAAPLRVHDVPDEECVDNFKDQFSDVLRCSFYFNSFFSVFDSTDGSRNNFRSDADMHEEIDSENEASSTERSLIPISSHTSSNSISILLPIINRLKYYLESKNMRKIFNLIGCEYMHPDHHLAMQNWWNILTSAKFVCFDDVQEDAYHFGLQTDFYVQFTSPIRRFMDIVVHRFVTAALDNAESPYTKEEVLAICKQCNIVQNRAKKYHKASQLLKITERFKEPLFLPVFIENFDDEKFSINIPHLKNIRGRVTEIKYSSLSLSEKPKLNTKQVYYMILKWERRFYDADPKICEKSYARMLIKVKSNECISLDNSRFVSHISTSNWAKLHQALFFKKILNLKNVWNEILDEVKTDKRMMIGQSEVTSEMRNNEMMVKHLVKCMLILKRGSVLAVQFGAKSNRGYLQPEIILLNLTNGKDICIDHRNDPTKCFADLAIDNSQSKYSSVEQYQSIWLPILAMEATSKAVADSDAILVDNVPVTLKRSNNSIYGTIKLDKFFCKQRALKIFPNSKDGEDETSDFMCIRYKHAHQFASGNQMVSHSFINNRWVGHAIAQFVSLNMDRKIELEFKLHHLYTDPPSCLFNSRGTPCSVEFLPRSLPDRRMEDAVKNMGDESVSAICKAIMLGSSVKDIKKEFEIPDSETFDIDVGDGVRINKNNITQQKAIQKALSQQFTLIQGPPGTGKTVTAIKIAYWFTKANSMKCNSTDPPQVLYCGPSNSSVDVAARWLKNLGKNCPKMVRVYSEVLENQIYPLPRDSLRPRGCMGRQYELIDHDELHDISLHHLIRHEHNKFSKEIKNYDKKFRSCVDKPELITDEEIDKYIKLITDACVHELRSYELILCTCTTSAHPRMKRGCNIKQVIIDECGMCMEPECFIPMVTHSAIEQVVLIGDHKQLQPIVCNQIAADLGLKISLFERYNDKAIMLNTQYRMHPAICEFPSINFYEGKLKTGVTYVPETFIDEIYVDVKKDGIEPMEKIIVERYIWKNMNIPMVFCHVEGAEKTLSISTDEGNVSSKSNKEEAEEVSRIFFYMVNNLKVATERISILSQYKAQCSAIELDLKGKGIEHPHVTTVIASQGDEWDYVILTLVRSMPEYEIQRFPSIGWCKRNMGFITDEHQINVALTRAKRGLVIIGNEHLLKCSIMWKNLIDHYKKKKCYYKDAKYFLPTHNRMDQFYGGEKFGNMENVPQRFRKSNTNSWNPKVRNNDKNKMNNSQYNIQDNKFNHFKQTSNIKNPQPNVAFIKTKQNTQEQSEKKYDNVFNN